MKQLTDTQKRTLAIVCMVLIMWHFTPALFRSLMAARAHRQAINTPARLVTTVASAAQPEIPASQPPTDAANIAKQTAFLGVWGNETISEDGTRCRIRLELRPSREEPGKVSGYEARSCFNINKMTLSPDLTSAKALQDATPVATVMTGSYFEGSVNFRVDKVVGTSPYVCPPNSYSVSAFGQRAIVAQWDGKGCPNSQIVLTSAGA